MRSLSVAGGVRAAKDPNTLIFQNDTAIGENMTTPAAAPTIMVSSTFYDLKQYREDIRRFIEDDLGYRPLLSEHPSFPINPDLSAIENCRERVQRDADVLVLVIGKRY